MKNVASPERSEFLDFFPEERITAEQLEEILREGSEERRVWALSHLLRYAQWDEIWSYVSRDQIRQRLSALDLPDTLRVAWARLLKIDSTAD